MNQNSRTHEKPEKSDSRQDAKGETIFNIQQEIFNFQRRTTDGREWFPEGLPVRRGGTSVLLGIGSEKVREEATDFADFTDGKPIRKSGKESGQRTEYWILKLFSAPAPPSLRVSTAAVRTRLIPHHSCVPEFQINFSG